MTKNDKNDKKKKELSKKNFTKKSIKNYQKINNKLSGNGPTDPPTDIVRSSETKYCKSEIWSWETDFLTNVN